ncbi:MAG: N-acetylmuramidase family protein [Actinobacteria bacterium]|nr:N-acetylmuramidase family protein [Actinomycetota bacterium]
MRWFILIMLGMLALLLIMGVLTEVAMAGPSTEVVLHDILAAHGSPLADLSYTPVAYWRLHRDFDLAGWLAVVAAETSLARDSFAARTRNIGCIKGGQVGRPWRDWRVGVTAGGYSIFPDFYTGQRASIRLIMDAGYNDLLRSHQWQAFANRYYGAGVPGIGQYVRNLERFHAAFARDARVRGLAW